MNPADDMAEAYLRGDLTLEEYRAKEEEHKIQEARDHGEYEDANLPSMQHLLSIMKALQRQGISDSEGLAIHLNEGNPSVIIHNRGFDQRVYIFSDEAGLQLIVPRGD